MSEHKLYLIIESGEPGDEVYKENVDETIELFCDSDFEKVISLKERLADLVTDDGEVVWVPPIKCECDNTHEQNETVCQYCWNNAEDHCPLCKSELMAGPNGCTICSKDGCHYWRE